MEYRSDIDWNASKATKYRWAEWLEEAEKAGGHIVMESGVDFTCTLAAVEQSARSWANSNRYTVSIKRIDGNKLAFKFDKIKSPMQQAAESIAAMSGNNLKNLTKSNQK